MLRLASLSPFALPSARHPMQIRCLDDLEPFAWSPRGPYFTQAVDEPNESATVLGRIADHQRSLLTAERLAAPRASDARAFAFSSGRRAAREALRIVGVIDWPITRQGRAPTWPSDVVGSIAHSRTLALAAVARTGAFSGIGVDIETPGRVTPRLAERVLTPTERSRLPTPEWRTALFSAKEAVYKAVNPQTGEYLALGDVEITLDGQTFRARTTRRCASSPVVAAGQGAVSRANAHWLTIFTTPAR